MNGSEAIDFLALGNEVIHLHAKPAVSVDRHLYSLCEVVGEKAGTDRNVVYFVLNHTRPGGHRHFAAWLSQDASSIPARLCAATLPQPKADAGNETHAQVVTDNEQARAAWLANWTKYASLTSSLEKIGQFTWNNFLLRHASHPQAMGLTWCSSSPMAPYFRYPRQRTPPETPPDSIEQWMKPIAECLRTSAGGYLKDEPWLIAAIMADELKRYYGDWGGGAFVSSHPKTR